MLLKSWAIPPASRPIDSSFWAWSSWLSAALRTLMSRIAAVTRIPSALSSGLSMISIGNSLPSLRRADELDPGADLLGQRVGRGAQVVGDQPFREALRDDVRHLLPDELVAAVAELLLGLDVEQDDLAAPGSPPPSRPEPPRAARGSGPPSAPDALPPPCAR